MTTMRAGTSGFSFKEWKGSFYPEDVPQGEWLRYYGERLPTVEINNTFYRLPKASVLESWAGDVGEDFRFSIKASRKITHFARLKNATDPTEYLFRTLETLGRRLGIVLFQLPPNFKQDLDRLRTFLEDVPPGARLGWEFRHDSWADEGTLELLREHGHALVLADVDDAEPPELVPTANWGYLRLRRTSYDDDDLRAWIDRIRAAGWNEAYVYFKHEDEGVGPRLAARFLELAS